MRRTNRADVPTSEPTRPTTPVFFFSGSRPPSSDVEQAGRKNKEAARAAESAAEESARRAADRAEASARAEARQRQIARANKMLYDETERVKSFHSSLLLSDVLFEREAQIEHAARTQSLRVKQDAQFVREQARAVSVAETAEAIKAAERRARAAAFRDGQLAQIDELRKQAEAARALDREEGAMIRRGALEEEQEKAREKAERRARALADAAATARAEEALALHRAAEAEKTRRFEEATELFARRKELTNLARAAREKAKREERNEKRDAIVAAMERTLAARAEEDSATFEREAAAKEAEAEALERAREAERAEDLAMVHRSRQQQLAIRAAARERARADEMAETARWRERSAELEIEEAATAAARRATHEDVQAALVRQMRRKQAKAAFEREVELEDAARAQQAMENDDALFRHYAETCVDEWARQGKSTRPMEVELAKPRDRVTRVGYAVD